MEIALEFLFEPHPGSKALLVAFTSFGTYEAPAQGHEWGRPLASYACHQLHLLDQRRHWYRAGSEGFGDSISGISAGIRVLAAQHGIETIVTLGSSMGGFASLVVGGVVRADLSVAISPQTNLDPEWNREHGDRRWDHWLAEMQAANYGLDSVRFAMEHGVAAKKTVVFFDPDDPLEQLHAAEIGDLPSVERRPVPGTGHATARDIHRSGVLHETLRSAGLTGGPERRDPV